MFEYLLFALISSIFFLARLMPVHRGGKQGCDAYYFLLCAESFRKHKKIPIVLEEYYTLEPQEQWYPPLFSVILGLIPKQALEKYHWVFNQILDYFTLVILFLLLLKLSGIYLASLFCIVYSLSGAILNELKSLTSRSLTLPLCLAFFVVNYFAASGDWVALVFAVGLFMVIIFTHKLTLQLLIFVNLFLSIAFFKPNYLSAIILAYLCAFLFFRRMTVKIIMAHWDIVKFWFRNWSLLGAHVVYQSKPYLDEKIQCQYYKQQSLREVVAQLKNLVHSNYWVLFLAPALLNFKNISGIFQYTTILLASILTWAILTTFVPLFRCFGLGIQYMKYSNAPSYVLASGILYLEPNRANMILMAVCLILSLRSYYYNCKTLRPTKSGYSGAFDSDMKEVILNIRSIPSIKLFCLPFHIADLVAYHAKRPVLWGTHGYGFKNVQEIFPVLQKPINEIIKKHSVTHVLLEKNYCTLRDLVLSNNIIVFENNKYILIEA